MTRLSLLGRIAAWLSVAGNSGLFPSISPLPLDVRHADFSGFLVSSDKYSPRNRASNSPSSKTLRSSTLASFRSLLQLISGRHGLVCRSRFRRVVVVHRARPKICSQKKKKKKELGQGVISARGFGWRRRQAGHALASSYR